MGCHGERASHAPSDAGAREPLPRYWLRDTELLDGPGGRAERSVDAPILVELSPDGRVRRAGEAATWLGYVPDALLRTPELERGLMLYAQRIGDLHLYSPSGPVVGRLHPGAVVTVASGDAASVLVANLGFQFRVNQEREDGIITGSSTGPLVAYVARDVLGTEPLTPAPRLSPEPGEPVRTHLLEPFRFDLRIRGTPPNERIPALACEDLRLTEKEGDNPTQYVRGVEIRALRVTSDYDQVFTGLWYSQYGAVSAFSLSCPAHAIVGSPNHWLLIGPRNPRSGTQGSPVSQEETSEIPDAFIQTRPPVPDPLVTAIEHDASIYWLLDGAEWNLAHFDSDAPRNKIPAGDYPQPTCNEWRFEHGRRLTKPDGLVTVEARLRYHKSIEIAPGVRVVPWHPIQYALSDGRRPGRLHVSPLEENHFDKCACDYDYALLASEGAELTMMGRSVPDDIVAYDPGEAERWFLSRDACEAARVRAIQAIEQDGSATTRVGFHVNGL
jgi:hypothetical protein